MIDPIDTADGSQIAITFSRGRMSLIARSSLAPTAHEVVLTLEESEKVLKLLTQECGKMRVYAARVTTDG